MHLPLLQPDPVVRSDAARNRGLLLEAADELIAEVGVERVTMDEVALRAGVGKGTVFRRFGSRQGLMAALLDRREAQWQAAVIGGPPPLGPGADPWDRLLAFAASRIKTTRVLSQLITATGRTSGRSLAAYSFTAMHVRMLLRELGVTGDLAFWTTSLLAPLEISVLELIEDDPDAEQRFRAGWEELARRIVSG